jgi:hypothetical protein
MKLAAMPSTRVHRDLAGDRGIALCGLARQLATVSMWAAPVSRPRSRSARRRKASSETGGLSLFLGLRASES